MASRVVHFLHRRRTRLGLLLIKCRGVERFFKNSREIVGVNKKVRIVCWVSWANFTSCKVDCSVEVGLLRQVWPCHRLPFFQKFFHNNLTGRNKMIPQNIFFYNLGRRKPGFLRQVLRGRGMILGHWMDKIFKIAPLLVSRKIRRFFLLFHVAFTGSVLQSHTMTRYISLLFQHTWFN